MDDEWIGCLMLAGLPEKYFPMIMAIEHSGIAITSDVVKTKLIDLAGNDSEAGSAFLSRGQHSRRFSHVGNSNGNIKIKSSWRRFAYVSDERKQTRQVILRAIGVETQAIIKISVVYRRIHNKTRRHTRFPQFF